MTSETQNPEQERKKEDLVVLWRKKKLKAMLKKFILYIILKKTL